MAQMSASGTEEAPARMRAVEPGARRRQRSRSSCAYSFQFVTAFAGPDGTGGTSSGAARRPNPSRRRLVARRRHLPLRCARRSARRTRRRATAGAPRCCPPAPPRRPAPARPTVARPVDASTPALRRPPVVAHVTPARTPAAPWRRRREACGSASVTSRRAPRLASFSSSGVPSRDDPPVVHDHDVVGQLVGLLEVLRRQQHGHALAEQLPDGLPDPLPADVGSSPVVGSSRNSTGGRVISEPARSSRRRMPPE